MTEFVVPSGMAQSVFENKYARKNEDGTYQTWAERVVEMMQGNFSLQDPGSWQARREYDKELTRAVELAAAGILPMSGRHLQQGDAEQRDKIGELFTNCATAAFSFLKFWLLLKGSGVGRLYDADVCRTNRLTLEA